MTEGQYKIETGEDKAWRELAGLEPSIVAARSGAVHDAATGAYTLRVFGEEFLVAPSTRTITSLSDPDRKPEYLLGLAVPVYLTQAKDIPVSGELVKEFRGGEFFFRGSHTLPLEEIAEKYGEDRGLFVEAGGALGGAALPMGDAAFEFYVFPKVRMAFVLWLTDEEFPARASLLFDSNADRHIALDVVWAVALVACQRVLKYK